MDFKSFLAQNPDYNTRDEKNKIKKQKNIELVIPTPIPYKNLKQKLNNELEISNPKSIEPIVETAIRTIKKCLLFDSRDRNKFIYPNSNEYVVSFNPDPSAIGAIIRNEIKNVTEIHIDFVVLPSIALNYPYIKLSIDEINSKSTSTTNGRTMDMYSVLIPIKTVNSSEFINCVVHNGCQTLPSKLANLKKLTIKFYDPDDILVDFGNDFLDPLNIKNSVQTMVMCTISHTEVDPTIIFNEQVF